MVRRTVLFSLIRVKAQPGWARAKAVTRLLIRASSRGAPRRNFRRPGVLKKRSSTVTAVPSGAPAASRPRLLPPSRRTRWACRSPLHRVVRVTRATAAMLGSASPRKPREVTRNRSSRCLILLVACRRKASSSSSGAMPVPSSVTVMEPHPPSRTWTVMRVAPASRAFSTSSFTTETGLSTTSPAAICAAVLGSNSLIATCFLLLPLSFCILFRRQRFLLQGVQELQRLQRSDPVQVRLPQQRRNPGLGCVSGRRAGRREQG